MFHSHSWDLLMPCTITVRQYSTVRSVLERKKKFLDWTLLFLLSYSKVDFLVDIRD